MRKHVAIIFCILILASYLSVPERAKGGNILTSPEYWFFPGNTYNSLYTGDNGSNDTSKKSRYTSIPFSYIEPASLRGILFWTGAALTSFAIFCYGNNKMDQREEGEKKQPGNN